MFFQEPEVVFIEVLPDIVTITSTEEKEIEACMSTMNPSPTTITQERYCQIMFHSSTDNYAEICATMPDDPSFGQKNANTVVGKSVTEAVTPASTVAPARSAPHFNNDLFK